MQMEYFQTRLHLVSWYCSCISLPLSLARLFHVHLLQPLKIFILIPFNFTLLNFAYRQVSSFSLLLIHLLSKETNSYKQQSIPIIPYLVSHPLGKLCISFPRNQLSAFSIVGVSYLNYLLALPRIWMFEVENQILSRSKSTYHY